MNLGESIQTCFSKYATFSGRASRSEYWWFQLTPYLLSFICIILLFNKLWGLAIFLMIVGGLALFLPSLAVGVRRFHDTGRSGVLYIVLCIFSGLLIPLIFLLIFLLEDSQPGENQYGPNPKQSNNKPKQRNNFSERQQLVEYQSNRPQNTMRSSEHNMQQRGEQEETLLAPSSARLIVGNRSYPLSPGRNIVGRSGETSEATVPIASEDRYMSRQHCCIDVKMRSNGLILAVLSNYHNKNVIKVNGHLIKKGDSVQLSDGNTIMMGHTTVTFKLS